MRTSSKWSAMRKPTNYCVGPIANRGCTRKCSVSAPLASERCQPPGKPGERGVSTPRLCYRVVHTPRSPALTQPRAPTSSGRPVDENSSCPRFGQPLRLRNRYNSTTSMFSMLAAHPDVQEISYMSIRTICPECQTIYQLADQQVGKKVRCKNCQSVFVAAEVASQQTAIRGDSAPPSSVRTKPAVAPLRRRGDDDDARAEPQRSPARNVEKKNILPWVLGGVAAVFGLLLLACGALITYLLMAQDKTVQVANTP